MSDFRLRISTPHTSGVVIRMDEKRLGIILSELNTGSTVDLDHFAEYPADLLAYIEAYTPVPLVILMCKRGRYFFVNLTRHVEISIR